MNAIARHRWVHVAPGERDAVATSCTDAVTRGRVAHWLALDRPLVARARQPGETSRGQPVGLCLPLAEEKRRIPLYLADEAIARVEEVAPLYEVASVLPAVASGVAREIAECARGLGFEARAFGSAAWQWRTGEVYLREASDLDLLAAPSGEHALREWLALLERLGATMPMRLDGEIECPSGDAVSWRELAGGAKDVLLKSPTGVSLAPAESVWKQFR